MSRYKRRSTASSSRGMIDVYYQTMYAVLTLPDSASVRDAINVQLPSPPTQFVGRGASIIYELLWAELQVEPASPEDGKSMRYYASLRLYESTIDDYTAFRVSDPSVLCCWHGGWDLFFLTSGMSALRYGNANSDVGVQRYDLQDQKGNGTLVARGNLVFEAGQEFSAGATPAGQVFNLRIAYRWRKVPLTEYIGLLSSQMTTAVTAS